MHELSLAQSLLRRATEAAETAQALSVRTIFLQIGELAGVDARQLAAAFEVVRAGTLCAGASLAIDRVPASWSCPACGLRIEPGAPLRCAVCEVPARLAQDADALTLVRIELEVADV